MMGQNEDDLSRLLDEFCALVFGALRPSPALPAAPEAAAVSLPPASSSAAVGVRRRRASPACLAALLLGASLALMLCGSVTFIIGFILMPWVLALVTMLHFLGMLSNLSALWRSSSGSPRSLQKVSDAYESNQRNWETKFITNGSRGGEGGRVYKLACAYKGDVWDSLEQEW